MTSFSAGRYVPTLTYVGRLGDSRKGLELFYDALDLLLAWPDAPPLRIWIIGGDPNEVEWSRKSARSRPELARAVDNGSVEFWGRVENNSLPEFYSRSTVLVVPSLREQFGLVAAEALMCGCPVVASRTGGLQDVIIPDRTGSLFTPGSSESLAATLSQYLTSRYLATWYGTNGGMWARAKFSASEIYGRMENLLGRLPARELPATTQEDSSEVYRLLEIAAISQKVTALIGQPLHSIKDLTSSHSTSFSAEMADGTRIFVKQFSGRPSFLSCISKLGHDTEPEIERTCRIRMLKAMAVSDLVPRIHLIDEDSGIVVQEQVDIRPEAEEVSVADEVLPAIERLSQIALDETDSSRADTLASVHYLRGMSCKDLDLGHVLAFDEFCRVMHAKYCGGLSRTQRIHPQIELIRIKHSLLFNTWLPRQLVTRWLSEINFLIDHEFILPLPLVSHGTLKAEHFLRKGGRTVLCDFDHAAWAFGPVDLTHFLWHQFEFSHRPSTKTMLELFSVHETNVAARFLGVCWFLVFRLRKDLSELTCGLSEVEQSSLEKLASFKEGLREFELIQ